MADLLAGQPAMPVQGKGAFIDALAQALQHTASLPQRALGAAGDLQRTGEYDPEPAVDVMMSMAGARTPFIRSGEAGIFGGRLAKTADTEALKRAEDMAAKGASREQIWNDTGWFQGADKKWRFEIPDNNATVSPGYGYFNEVIEHPDFFDAYPHTKRYVANISYGDPKGSYSAGQMDATAPNRFDQSSIALHELQHAVQNREGFELGGAPGQGSNAVFDYDAPSVKAIIAERDKFERVLSKVPYMLGNGEMNPHFKEIQKNIARLDRQAEAEAAMSGYRRLAGETEARNVQARQTMTPSERRDKPPWLTEDVPLSQQIVRALQGG